MMPIAVTNWFVCRRGGQAPCHVVDSGRPPTSRTDRATINTTIDNYWRGRSHERRLTSRPDVMWVESNHAVNWSNGRLDPTERSTQYVGGSSGLSASDDISIRLLYDGCETAWRLAHGCRLNMLYGYSRRSTLPAAATVFMRAWRRYGGNLSTNNGALTTGCSDCCCCSSSCCCCGC